MNDESSPETHFRKLALEAKHDYDSCDACLFIESQDFAQYDGLSETGCAHVHDALMNAFNNVREDEKKKYFTKCCT